MQLQLYSLHTRKSVVNVELGLSKYKASWMLCSPTRYLAWTSSLYIRFSYAQILSFNDLCKPIYQAVDLHQRLVKSTHHCMQCVCATSSPAPASHFCKQHHGFQSHKGYKSRHRDESATHTTTAVSTKHCTSLTKGPA
jgi:hypothetical protein